MDTVANGAIAVAYLIIPFALVPLLFTANREVRLNLLLAKLFVLSCGIGHGLSALGIMVPPWHWLTAAVSLTAMVVLLKSRSRLKQIGETFHIFEATWEQSLTGKILCDRRGDDLVLLKINPAAVLLTNNLIQPGDLFCEKIPLNRIKAYPYQIPLIELYFQVLESGESRRLEFQLQGELSGWFLNLVTPLSKTMLYMAFAEISGEIRDPLTGLYNRRAIEMEIDEWAACLFIDLDRFKLVNDQRGHVVGDRLLVEVSATLQAVANSHNGIAVRNGGDEFLVLLPALVGSLDQALAIAHQSLESILAIEVDGANVGASIGVSVAPVDAFIDDSPIDQLIQAAETALREAKNKRKLSAPENRVEAWDSKMAQHRLRQITLEGYLSQRSSEDEFWLAYQPICSMVTGEIVGAEALLRWDSVQLGRVPPGEFIPVAEATGLVHRISDWVLRQALDQLVLWNAIDPKFTLSINISPLELEDDGFLDRILNRVVESGASRQNFGVEITERGIYSNLERYLAGLQGLRDMSLKLKVDDFGTGQAGLSQLLQFRFDEVKVDRCFIPTHPEDLEKLAICMAIAGLAEGIGFDLVAEGIEEEAQRDLMLSLNYKYGQGYLFSRPMRAEALTILIREKTALSPRF